MSSLDWSIFSTATRSVRNFGHGGRIDRYPHTLCRRSTVPFFRSTSTAYSLSMSSGTSEAAVRGLEIVMLSLQPRDLLRLLPPFSSCAAFLDAASAPSSSAFLPVLAALPSSSAFFLDRGLPRCRLHLPPSFDFLAACSRGLSRAHRLLLAASPRTRPVPPPSAWPPRWPLPAPSHFFCGSSGLPNTDRQTASRIRARMIIPHPDLLLSFLLAAFSSFAPSLRFQLLFRIARRASLFGGSPPSAFLRRLLFAVFLS